MKRLLLVAPAGEIIIPSDIARFGKSIFHVFRNTLACLAALTPDDWEVKVVDESVERLKIESGWDVVGITVSTFMAVRAYEIARAFKQRGSTVVLGGIHPTAMPEEASRHCDVVVVGEAEYLWPTVLRDIAAGIIKPVYKNTCAVQAADFALPKRRLLDGKSLFTACSMQASRGCNNNCEFCSVSIAGHRGLRERSLDLVVAEIASLPHGKRVHFLDDNLFQHSRFCDLLNVLETSGRTWCAQLPIAACSDRDLLFRIRQSGCRAIMFGFDSLAIASKTKGATGITPLEAVQRTHDLGILVEGSFVFGFDHDTVGVFDETLEFCLRAKLEAAAFHILTPYPGTGLFERMQKQGRLYRDATDPLVSGIVYPWYVYDTAHTVFQPKNMTAEQLEDSFLRCIHEFYGWTGIVGRAGRLLQSPSAVGLNLLLAAGFRMPSGYKVTRDRFREERRLL